MVLRAYVGVHYRLLAYLVYDIVQFILFTQFVNRYVDIIKCLVRLYFYLHDCSDQYHV